MVEPSHVRTIGSFFNDLVKKNIRISRYGRSDTRNGEFIQPFNSPFLVGLKATIEFFRKDEFNSSRQKIHSPLQIALK